jgi:hypothetical protein
MLMNSLNDAKASLGHNNELCIFTTCRQSIDVSFCLKTTYKPGPDSKSIHFVGKCSSYLGKYRICQTTWNYMPEDVIFIATDGQTGNLTID